MFIFLFLLWIIFNGQCTTEIAAFGIVISLAIYAFMCVFMGYSIKKDIQLFRTLGYFIVYIWVLIIEIIKANLTMMKFIVIKQEYELKPVIFKLHTKLKSNVCRVLLSNAITLTPGTITVSMERDALIIHAVDESLIVENDSDFIFEKLLLKMEGVKNG